MKGKAFVAITLLAACSSQKPKVTPAPAFELPFAVETPPDSVRGRFVGTIRRDGGWLDVTIDTAMVDLPPGPAELWRGLTIRPFVAADYGRGDFKAPAES